MATEKQIAANRANAKRSTGPRTAAGKKKSSRNAYRHGLSRIEPSESCSAGGIDAITGLLGQAPEDQLAAARDFVHAHVALARIRSVRAAQWASIDLNDSLEANVKALKQLAALDRYERYALTKRSQASKRLH
jgi:hypothetical protein